MEHKVADDPGVSREPFSNPGTHSGAWSVLVTVEVREESVEVTSVVAAAVVVSRKLRQISA